MTTRAGNIITPRVPRPLRGFTLIEVLLAAFVLALGVLGLAALFAGGARQQQLATETTRATSLADAAIAWQANFGVMSSLDENDDGRPDFEQTVDVGRWFALATIESNNINNGRVSLVTRLSNGSLLRYDPAGTGPGLTRFQPHFRKVNNTPIILYQRPPHWSPKLNDSNPADGPIQEASNSAAVSPTSYDPRQPGSMFAVRPYSLFTPNPTALPNQRIGGPAFLPDRAILPETVELTVTYFEYNERYVFNQQPTLAAFDRFNLPDGTGQAIPGTAVAATPAGRVINDPSISDFRWVDPRSSLFTGGSPIVPLNLRIPVNNLPSEVRNPSGPLAGPNPPQFPQRRVWEADGNLFHYAVFMPEGGRYPTEFNVNNPPAVTAVASRPAYLIMYLAPDLNNNDLDTPNPTIVGFDLAGVLTDNLRVPSGLAGIGEEAGPLRSVEQIRVERYASRLERMPAPRDRVVTVPDDTREDGTRPVLGYSTLYRRTPDGQGEIAIFGYRISPTTRRGSFVPYEDPAFYEPAANAQSNRLSPIVNSDFLVEWDPNREQFYVLLDEAGNPDAIIRPGAQILFAGPPAAPGSATQSNDAFGADAAVRIVARVRQGNQLRGYLDRPPTFRGRPLGNLGNAPPSQQRLTGWHVRDRVRSAELIDGIPANAQPLYQLESLEVRIVPMRER